MYQLTLAEEPSNRADRRFKRTFIRCAWLRRVAGRDRPVQVLGERDGHRDGQAVEGLRNRRLDTGRTPFIWIDELTQRSARAAAPRIRLGSANLACVLYRFYVFTDPADVNARRDQLNQHAGWHRLMKDLLCEPQDSRT
jgi:hypothetical protein